MLVQLPQFTFRNKKYTFDYRLSQLRIIGKKGVRFIMLNNNENELLDNAIYHKDRRLLNACMRDISWKL